MRLENVDMLKQESFPFAKYKLVESESPIDLQKAVGREIAQHEFSFQEDCDASRSRITCVRLSQMVLFGVRFASRLHAATAPINALQLVVPLAGTMVRNHKGVSRVATPNEGFLLGPGEPVDLDWHKDCTAVVAWIDEHILADMVYSHFGKSCTDSIRFPSCVSMNCGVGLSIGNSLSTIVNELEDENSLFSRGITSKRIEEVLVTSLLYASSDIPDLQKQENLRGNSTLQTALDYIHAHIDEDISALDLVAATGVSLRKLQYDFAAKFGMGPMSKVRQEKLLRARDLLKVSDPKESKVADIAARLGFFDRHYFTKVYKNEFGEWPSVTLNRSYLKF